MAESHAFPRRRRFIKLTATGLVVAPFANALLRENAAAADLISESDPAAAKLKYKADATKAPERTNPDELCDNCLLYESKDSAYGTCSVLENKLVAAKGWCISWSG
jgi:hypothetical protein